MVARKPAVELGLLLFVAVHTETHLKINRDQTIILFNIPVARRAIDLVPDMGLVIKFDMIRDIIDSDPGDRGLGIIIFPLLHDFRVLRNDILMAEEAQTHGGDPCVFGAICEGMAEPAADLFRARMNPVAEINRLFGADGLMGIEIVKIGHRCQQQDPCQSPGSPS
jgi:hypothetical protein